MDLTPRVLEGEFVRLEPMALEHIQPLCVVGLVEELWRVAANVNKTPDDMRHYVEIALDEQSRGVSLPFVTRDKTSDKIVGSTRFGNIDVDNRKVEIGWTWINPEWQRSFVNTEAKLLMLTHAFETWKCLRVEFKIDALNQKSRTAIARLGAKEEGTLRRHMITESGRFRDSVFFSIISDEWETVKKNLTAKLRSN
ncbi:MAG: GNAT family N-acetyltransferase [Saprospiraceae bacterium]|nr:GNAT family N-acetyltransferase [Pyrinomonadaceae bacterium]